MGCGQSSSVTESITRNGRVKSERERKTMVEKQRNGDLKQKNAADKDVYKAIDNHARQAPAKLKKSADELVAYLSSASSDPKILVRGFFVWISENIRYDVDGYFGRTQKGPHDCAGVMKTGRSVCEGYANVMEELCRKANITVKKISGFAKGVGHSADEVISESSKTNHAWNAVQIDGKWYLIDSTWGAGHLNTNNEFVKEFNDFYFMANPKQLISTHFPYMNGNLRESMGWQRLEKPISLEEFSRGVEYKSSAFKIDAKALSHPYGFVEMKNELKMIFKSEGPEDINFSARLTLHDGNWRREQSNATFGYLENGVFNLLVRPPKVGKYTMDVFGTPVSDKRLNDIPQLMTYVIKCMEVKNTGLTYPHTFHDFGVERVILREPMFGKLPANREVMFKLEAPYLQTVMAGDVYLEHNGQTFTGLVKTGKPGTLTVFGNREGRYDRLKGLLEYEVV